MPRRRPTATAAGVDAAGWAAEGATQVPRGDRCTCRPWPCTGWSGCDPRCRACRNGPFITDAEARWVATGTDRQGRRVELAGVRWRPKQPARSTTQPAKHTERKVQRSR
jgi:hypothetical protein